MRSVTEEMSAQAVAAMPRETILLAAVQGGIAHIAQTAAKELGHPILLGDVILTILAWTGASALRNLSWEGFIHAGYAPDFQADRNLFAERSIKLKYGFEACQVRNPVKGWTDLLIDIPYGQAAAHLVISGEGAPFTEESYDLTALLCTCIAAELRRQSEATQWAHGYSAEQFLLRLISGEEPDERVLSFRAGLAGLEMEADYILLLVDLNKYHPVCHSISTIRSTLDEMLRGCSAIIDDTLTVLCTGTQFTKRIQELISDLFKKNHVQGVYSNSFFRLAEVSRSYRKTSRLLTLRGCGENTPLTPGEELEIFYLVDSYFREEGRLPIDHPAVYALSEAGRNGNTDYLNTLYIYLRCGKKPVLAGERLHIHRNTLDYRLNRIQALTNIDWNDGDLLFRLYFQLSALHYGQIKGRLL